MHDDVTVKRTLVLTSAYGVCRQLGTIVPPVTSASAYATFQHLAFSASLVVHNLEDAAITLDEMAFVPVSDAASAAPPALAFTRMEVPVTIAAHSASALGVYIPANELKLTGVRQRLHRLLQRRDAARRRAAASGPLLQRLPDTADRLRPAVCPAAVVRPAHLARALTAATGLLEASGIRSARAVPSLSTRRPIQSPSR